MVIVAEPNGSVAAAALSAEIRRIIGDCFGLAVGDVVLVPGGTIDRTTSGKIRRAAVHESHERGELTGRSIQWALTREHDRRLHALRRNVGRSRRRIPARHKSRDSKSAAAKSPAASSGSRASRTVKSTRPTGGTASSKISISRPVTPADESNTSPRSR